MIWKVNLLQLLWILTQSLDTREQNWNSEALPVGELCVYFFALWIPWIYFAYMLDCWTPLFCHAIDLENFHSREMWEISMEGLLSLIRKTTQSSLSYICEKTGDSLSNKVCFFEVIKRFPI